MSFRQKLLAGFAATILLCVAVTSASVYCTMAASFEQANQAPRADSVAAQLDLEFSAAARKSSAKLASLAASQTVQRIALEINPQARGCGGRR